MIGSKGEARCPGHDDQVASLSLGVGDADRALVKCMAGCRTKDVVEALGLRLGDLFSDEPRSKIVVAYDYRDEAGVLLFQVVRLEPKDFRRRQPDGDGWIWNTKGVRDVLYRLPGLGSAETVYVVEGEKDADVLASVGIAATCNAGGAGKWKPHHAEPLAGKHVIIVADKDEPGRKHAIQVAESLKGVAASVRIVQARTGKDAADHLAAGHTVAEFEPMTEQDEPRRFARTDSGNAEMLAALHSKSLRFDHKRHRWLIFEGHHWRQDAAEEITQLARNTARERYKRAGDLEDADERRREAVWACGSESRQKMDAALAVGRSEPALADDGASWDADPWLLGVTNGVVELKSGRLRPGRRDDHITRASSITFNPEAVAPRWMAFLEEVFNGKGDLIRFVKKSVGYSLTGSTQEQCLFLCHGSGANGKSTLLRILRDLLGPYAADTPFSTIEYYERQAIPSDVAALEGKRLVTASESGTATRLNEARIKALTGGDVITARFLHAEWFTFRPEAKIWLACNRKPRVADTTKGFWRRMRLIPFLRRFEGADADPRLEVILESELQGILRWAIEGCLLWQNEGLTMPEEVAQATSDYQLQSDPVGDFLSSCTRLGSMYRSRASKLYQSYLAWAKIEGIGEKETIGRRSFGEEISERFDKVHERDGWWYIGISINESNDLPS